MTGTLIELEVFVAKTYLFCSKSTMLKSFGLEIPIAKAIALCNTTEVTENLDFRLALDAWLWGAHFLSRRGRHVNARRLNMASNISVVFFSLMPLNLTDEDYLFLGTASFSGSTVQYNINFLCTWNEQSLVDRTRQSPQGWDPCSLRAFHGKHDKSSGILKLTPRTKTKGRSLLNCIFTFT